MTSTANGISSDEENGQEEEIALRINKRGVKRGVKRGPYKKHSSSVCKKRIIATAKKDCDWKLVASANGVPIATAYGWLLRSEDKPKKKGGYRPKKLSPDDVEFMLHLVEKTPTITLLEIKSKVAELREISISTTSIHKYLEAKMYTVKKIIPEPVTMNSDNNKQKRKDYVQKLMTDIGAGKLIIYIDETNVNLFLRRNQGRSRKGTRCSVVAPTSKGKNVHVIGAISQRGLVHWERRRGSYRNADCCDWLRRMLRSVTEPLHNVVVVSDNAPVHCSLETVFEEEEFSGARLLRTAPYSAPINPIEECWSVLKASMKRELSGKMTEMLSNNHEGVTQTEYRLSFLEQIIDNNIATITPMLCLSTCNHVQKHFSKIMNLQDLKMDDNI